jgi:hypothetical protein
MMSPRASRVPTSLIDCRPIVSDSAKQPGDASAEPTSQEPDEAGSELLAELLEGAQPQPDRNIVVRTRVGRLVAWAIGRAPRVDFEGNELGPLPARSTIALDPTTILAAIQDERGVLLTFEDGKPHAPIITGLLQPIGEFDAPPEVWQDEEAEDPDDASEAAEGEAFTPTEARVDGKRVEIEAADEIVLRCGQASIVLRRNGRVVIRGTYVETRSRGVNRIKGGSVEIN